MRTEFDLLKLAFSELRTPHKSAAGGLRDEIFFLVQPPYGLPWSAEIFPDLEQPDVYSVSVALWDRLADFPDHEILSESGHEVGSAEYVALKQSMLADSPQFGDLCIQFRGDSSTHSLRKSLATRSVLCPWNLLLSRLRRSSFVLEIHLHV